MAQFRATIVGQRGEASRLGNKKTGLVARVNGWNLGVRVEADYDADFDRDTFTVYLTGGSNGGHDSVLLGTFTAEQLDALHDLKMQRALQDALAEVK
jgi:hypothetical protein